MSNGRKFKSISLRGISKKGKILVLAYDQGLEHGPTDFNDKNVNPIYIIDIAKCGGFTALAFQKGIAEKYNKEIKKSKVPLILKLNGKTNLLKGEPYSTQLATVKEAIELGASAVGYTIYLGSKFESKMFDEFADIEREAHKKNLPVVVWMYPRGKAVKNDVSKEMMAYASRVALELGADVVKMKYGGNPKDLSWAVKSAGRTKVVISGGAKKDEKLFIKQLKDIMNSGAVGMAIGRNVWQHKKPVEFSKKIGKVVGV